MQLDGWQHAAQSLYPPSSSITWWLGTALELSTLMVVPAIQL
jgi:hypothetical protein